MYTVCLYCSRPLGANEVIERFPVGRRLAFDAAKGRLWVVCTSCQRWCLSPIEDRWEAIEECERAFRDARVRASTSEIGLVRLGEGLELVRIGAPLKPEMAAWRYGREFSARRRKAVAVTAGVASVAALGGAAAIVTGAASAYLGLFAFGPAVIHVTGLAGFIGYSAYDSARAIPLQVNGRTVHVYRADLRESHLVPTDDAVGWGIRLKHAYARTTLTGDDAMRVASRLLARANGRGASGNMVDSSLRRLVEAPTIDAFIRTAAARAGSLADDFAERKREYMRAFERNAFTAGKFDETANPAGFSRMAAPVRLALEMALHEESERVALQGELAPLVAAWREAEEIAGIADRLLVPPAIDARIEAERRRDRV
jgi:hypothetical protein